MHAHNCILIKTAPEIALKSDFVRREFTAKLVENIKTSLRQNSLTAEKILKDSGRLAIFSKDNDLEKIHGILGKVFGLHSFAPAFLSEAKSLEEISKIAVEISQKEFPPQATFAVRANRATKADFSSKDIENFVGKKILDAMPKLKVNLTKPEKELFIEVRNFGTLFFTDGQQGLKGLPLGCEGNVAFYFQGKPQEFLAALLMMSRGCNIFPVLKAKNAQLDKLINSLIPFNSFRQFAVTEEKDINNLIEAYSIQAIATGDESLDLANFMEFDSRFSLPVFRPLIAFPEELKEKKLEVMKVQE